MKRLLKTVTLMVLLTSSGMVSAACSTAASSSTAKGPWDGSKAALGFTFNSGNTNDTNFNGELDVVYAVNPWSNIVKVSGQYGSSEDILSKENVALNEQVNYSFNNIASINNFVYFQSLTMYDAFAPLEQTYTQTVGYGRDWVKNNCWTFSTQLGPGYRFAIEQGGVKEDSALVGVFTVSTAWNITKSTQLSENVTYELGPPTNHLKSITAFTNTLVANLNVQVSFTVENYSKVDSGKKNTSTSTAVSLVYGF